MKKNAFTLVELLSVIILLSVLLLIIAPNVINSEKRTSENEWKAVVNRINQAAEIYLEQNVNNITVTDCGYSIKVQELLDYGLLSKPINDPRTNVEIDYNTYVSVGKTNGLYSYTYPGLNLTTKQVKTTSFGNMFTLFTDGTLYKQTYDAGINGFKNEIVDLGQKVSYIVDRPNWPLMAAVTEDGSLYIWKTRNDSNLFVANFSNSPTKINLNGRVKKVSYSGYHILVLLENGDVYAWGFNTYGQLGNENLVSCNKDVEAADPACVINVPVKVNLPFPAKDIVAGEEHSMALLEDNTLYTWGRNKEGELGLGNTTSTNIPKQITLPTKPTYIGAGHDWSIVLLDNKDGYVWGQNNAGQLGDGTNTISNLPKKISLPSKIKMLSTGWNFTVVALENGETYTWGSNVYGSLGIGNTTNSNLPKKITLPLSVKEISTASYTVKVILENGDVYMWGDNYSGIYGSGAGTYSIPVSGTFPTSNSPVKIDYSKLCEIK